MKVKKNVINLAKMYPELEERMKDAAMRGTVEEIIKYDPFGRHSGEYKVHIFSFEM